MFSIIHKLVASICPRNVHAKTTKPIDKKYQMKTHKILSFDISETLEF